MAKIYSKGHAVKLPAFTLTYDADDVAHSETITAEVAKIGKLTILEVIIAATTNNVTTVITIVSPQGGLLYTSSSQADDGTRVLTPNIPIETGTVITATISGITGDAGNKTIVMSGYIENMW